MDEQSLQTLAFTYAEARKEKDWFTIDHLKGLLKASGCSLIHINKNPVTFKVRLSGVDQRFYNSDGYPVDTTDPSIIYAAVTGANPL